jgi:hypothetical protein
MITPAGASAGATLVCVSQALIDLLLGFVVKRSCDSHFNFIFLA